MRSELYFFCLLEVLLKGDHVGGLKVRGRDVSVGEVASLKKKSLKNIWHPFSSRVLPDERGTLKSLFHISTNS